MLDNLNNFNETFVVEARLTDLSLRETGNYTFTEDVFNLNLNYHETDFTFIDFYFFPGFNFCPTQYGTTRSFAV